VINRAQYLQAQLDPFAVEPVNVFGMLAFEVIENCDLLEPNNFLLEVSQKVFCKGVIEKVEFV
jgi:hypothetical protein